MFRILVLSILLTCALLPCKAQKRTGEKTKPVFVVGKVLSAPDSTMVNQLFLDGLHEKMIQNTELATDYFKRVIELDPANDAAMYELGAIYHSENKEKEAEAQIRNAVTVKPQNKWYWLLLAEIYKDTNEVAQLVAVFDELTRLEPDNPNNYFDKANAFVIQNRIAEANSVYNEIEKRYGVSDELSEARQKIYIRQGKPEKAAAELEKQVLNNPEDLKSLLNLADIYNRSGDHDKALSVLKKALGVDAGNVLVHLSLADTYRGLKRYDEAFSELKLAFENNSFSIDEKVRIVLSFFPEFADEKAKSRAHDLASIVARVHSDDPKAFALYGDVLFQEQKMEEAAAAYRRAIKLNDQVYQIWEQLLRIELNGGEFNQAINDGENALSIFPNQAALYLLTSIGYAQTQKHEKAISYLKTAASLESDDKEVLAQIYSGMGDSYHALKKFTESDEAYTKALQIKPDNSYTLNNFAYYLALRGEGLEKAEEMALRAIKLEPNDASSEDTYAWILFKRKKYRDARVWIEKAIGHGQKPSAVQLEHYGDILFFLDEKGKALQQWQLAKSAGGGSDKLQQKIDAKKYIE